MKKDELRGIFREKRVSLDGRDRLRMDDLMLLQFQQMDYSGIRTVLSYWPISGHAEPNTHLFTRYLAHILPELQLSYPVSDTKKHTMQAIAVTEDTIYSTNKWGITEPKEGNEVHPQQIDLVLVPMLVCDTDGYRVGYGKGYYDKYLAQCRQNVVKIGFSYFEPVEAITDRGQFDVPLSYCITPQQIYEF